MKTCTFFRLRGMPSLSFIPFGVPWKEITSNNRLRWYMQSLLIERHRDCVVSLSCPKLTRWLALALVIVVSFFLSLSPTKIALAFSIRSVTKFSQMIHNFSYWEKSLTRWSIVIEHSYSKSSSNIIGLILFIIISLWQQFFLHLEILITRDRGGR